MDTELRPGDAAAAVLMSFFMAVIVGGLVDIGNGPTWAVVGLGAMTWLLAMLVLLVGLSRSMPTC